MAFELRRGDVCRMTREITAGGNRAFGRWEEVEVTGIDPDPQRPGYKYVVYSKSLGRPVRVRGADLVRKYCGGCGAEVSPAAFDCPGCGWVVPGREADRREQERLEESKKRTPPGGAPPYFFPNPF